MKESGDLNHEAYFGHQHVTLIQPTSGWHVTNWRELWAYRDLLGLLVWRDFAVRYKQTVLGPLWFIIQPVLTALIFAGVFSKVGKIPTAGVPAPLFYLCGLLVWNYFSSTFNSTSSALTANASLFGKIYFPRLIIPLSSVISNLFLLAIQLVTFFVFYVVYKTSLNAGQTFSARPEALMLIPAVLIQVAAFSLGLGLCFAALTAKYRDFSVLAGFMLQLWMYITPIIYPLTQVPDHWRWLMGINPMTMPVECFRHLLLDAGTPSTGLIILSIGLTLVFLVSGLLLFARVEKTFVDTV